MNNFDQDVLKFREFLDRDETRETSLAMCKAVGTTSVPAAVRLFPDVKEINLFGSGFTSIEPISLLRNIERLLMKGIECASLFGIEYCTSLREIDASKNRIISLSPLSRLQRLEKLIIFENPVRGDEAGLDLCKLRILNVCSIKNPPLHSFETSPLEVLYADNCGLDSISAVLRFVGLKTLALNENSISSIDGIEGLKMLKNLEMDDNSVESVDSLLGLKSLVRLSIRDNVISDAAALASIGSLKELFLSGNPVQSLEMLKMRNLDCFEFEE